VLCLLKFDRCASFFKLLLDFFSFVFGSTFLNGCRCTLNGIFSVFQALPGDSAYCLNNSNLVITNASKNDVKFVLLGSSFATGITSSRRCCCN
jgi:hypothetical protein